MQGFVRAVIITFHWSHSVARCRAEERAGQGTTGQERGNTDQTLPVILLCDMTVVSKTLVLLSDLSEV